MGYIGMEKRRNGGANWILLCIGTERDPVDGAFNDKLPLSERVKKQKFRKRRNKGTRGHKGQDC